MKSKEVILLLSGGIDSTTLLADLTAEGKAIHALSFDYGQRHRIELTFAERNARKYGVTSHHFLNIDLSTIADSNALTGYKQPSFKINTREIPNPNYVPGRNLLMLSHAASYAEAKGLTDIYLAANADDVKKFPDCRPTFISALNQLFQSCLTQSSIQVYTPFINLKKVEVVKKGMELGVEMEDTLSCYNPLDKIPCGTCMSCMIRQDALRKALVTRKQ